jgi:hypothetical protein
VALGKSTVRTNLVWRGSSIGDVVPQIDIGIRANKATAKQGRPVSGISRSTGMTSNRLRFPSAPSIRRPEGARS